MPIACLMSLVESYVRHPSCGSNAEPKVSAAAQCATKGNGVALSQPRVAFGCRRDTCSDNLLQGESACHNLLKYNENELLSIGHGERACKQLFFLPPKADFFYGQRPLFEPWRLLSSCKAWRWGWRGQQEGKLVFRLASPTTTKRRSRQQSPWLFVFTSPTNRSS